MNIAIIVAAGRGARFGAKIPKQYLPFAGICALERSIQIFIPYVDHIQVVINQEDVALYEKIAVKYQLLPAVFGGDLRQDSVKNALAAIGPLNPTNVLIHDAVRPFVSGDNISRLLAQLKQHKAVIVAAKAVDSIKQVADHKIIRSLDRAEIYQAQTPQGFRYEVLKTAYDNLAAVVSDDAAALEAAGVEVYVIEVSGNNNKITYPHDVAILHETRIGMGFDTHKFISDNAKEIALGGITVPHNKSIEAHSDGDVVLHALTDAILGAIGAGDIGLHFPPEQEKWRKVASKIFVEFAYNLAKEKHMRIVNVDITILAENPKIRPYSKKMQNEIANILQIEEERINIKATTMEKMGFIGREEGIAAQVVVAMQEVSGFM